MIKLLLFLALFCFTHISIAATTFKLTWNSVEGATAYKAQYRIDDGSWSYVDTVETEAVFSIDMAVGSTLYAKVRGCHEAGTSCKEGDFSDQVVFRFNLDAPKGVKLIVIVVEP